MEDGLPVKIKPKRAKVLAFEDETGKTVFSKNNIVVLNPGGNVSGEYEKTFNLSIHFVWIDTEIIIPIKDLTSRVSLVDYEMEKTREIRGKDGTFGVE